MAKSSKTVVLFSINYPYNTLEHSFLKDELKYLNENFSNVYVVPQSIVGDRFEIPKEIIIDESLADWLVKPSFSQKVRTILSPFFLQELIKIKFDRKKIRLSLAARLSGIITYDWIVNFLGDKDKSEIILYSFWFNFTTLGFVLYKSNFSEVKIVSRCHNFDLYGNEQNYFYVPFQESVLNSIDAVYPDSQLGEDFLKAKFPLSKTKASLMGVSPSPMDNIPSKDGVIRIVSCSYVIPRKRIGLLLEGLIYLAYKNPTQQIKWTHVGEGPEWTRVKEESKKAPSNLSIDFLGNLSNEALHKYYQTNNVDLFVNTSTKEGTPVSIMEAISYGIPILATAFGGNQEVVEKGAGLLLIPNPSKEEIAQKIIALIESGELSSYRIKAKMVWENYYNSDRNYKDFCKRLGEA